MNEARRVSSSADLQAVSVGTVDTTSVMQVLYRARRALEEFGWCQDTLALLDGRVGDGRQPRMCLDAAILYGAGVMVPATARVVDKNKTIPIMIDTEKVFREHLADRPTRRVFLQAAMYVRQVVGSDSLEAWNDYPGRELDEVLDALSQATELAESEG